MTNWVSSLLKGDLFKKEDVDNTTVDEKIRNAAGGNPFVRSAMESEKKDASVTKTASVTALIDPNRKKTVEGLSNENLAAMLTELTLRDKGEYVSENWFKMHPEMQALVLSNRKKAEADLYALVPKHTMAKTAALSQIWTVSKGEDGIESIIRMFDGDIHKDADTKEVCTTLLSGVSSLSVGDGIKNVSFESVPAGTKGSIVKIDPMAGKTLSVFCQFDKVGGYWLSPDQIELVERGSLRRTSSLTKSADSIDVAECVECGHKIINDVCEPSCHGRKSAALGKIADTVEVEKSIKAMVAQDKPYAETEAMVKAKYPDASFTQGDYERIRSALVEAPLEKSFTGKPQKRDDLKHQVPAPYRSADEQNYTPNTADFGTVPDVRDRLSPAMIANRLSKFDKKSWIAKCEDCDHQFDSDQASVSHQREYPGGSAQPVGLCPNCGADSHRWLDLGDDGNEDSDCQSCMGTGIGQAGPDSKCANCKGRGYHLPKAKDSNNAFSISKFDKTSAKLLERVPYTREDGREVTRSVYECDSCGEPVLCREALTNRCPCGAMYNMSGQRLRPESEWEENMDEEYFSGTASLSKFDKVAGVDPNIFKQVLEMYARNKGMDVEALTYQDYQTVLRSLEDGVTTPQELATTSASLKKKYPNARWRSLSTGELCIEVPGKPNEYRTFDASEKDLMLSVLAWSCTAKGERAKIKDLKNRLDDSDDPQEIKHLCDAIDAIETRMEKDTERREKRKKDKAEKAHSGEAPPSAPATPLHADDPKEITSEKTQYVDETTGEVKKPEDLGMDPNNSDPSKTPEEMTTTDGKKLKKQVVQSGLSKFDKVATQEYKYLVPITAEKWEEGEEAESVDEETGEAEGGSEPGYVEVSFEHIPEHCLDEMVEDFNSSELEQYIHDEALKAKVEQIRMGSVRVGEVIVTVVANQELTPEDQQAMADYLNGQCSDGWGEGFEQRETDGYSIHTWSRGGPGVRLASPKKSPANPA